MTPISRFKVPLAIEVRGGVFIACRVQVGQLAPAHVCKSANFLGIDDFGFSALKHNEFGLARLSATCFFLDH